VYVNFLGPQNLDCMSVFWDLKIWRQILLVNKVLKGALDVMQIMAPESRSINLRIRTWICAVCLFCVWDLKRWIDGLVKTQSGRGCDSEGT
jgi:hypothetical protein